MKKVLIVAITCLSFIACKKEDEANNNTGPAAGDCSKFPYRKGTSVTLTPVGGGTPSTTVYTKDTTVAGQYYVGATTNASGITLTVYSGLTSAKEVIGLLPPSGDLPRTNMIYYKLASPVNTSWSYTYTSIALPTSISYKYTYTIVSNSETFSFNGTNYTGGQRVKLDFQMLASGSVLSTATTFGTYFCGIGNTRSEDGTTVRTLTAYTY